MPDFLDGMTWHPHAEVERWRLPMQTIIRAKFSEVCAPADAPRPISEHLLYLISCLEGGHENRPARGVVGAVINRKYLEKPSNKNAQISFVHTELMLRFLRADHDAQKYFLQAVWDFMDAREEASRYLEIEFQWSRDSKRVMSVARNNRAELVFGIT